MFYCKENDKVIETGVLVLFQMLFFYLLTVINLYFKINDFQYS